MVKNIDTNTHTDTHTHTLANIHTHTHTHTHTQTIETNGFGNFLLGNPTTTTLLKSLPLTAAGLLL